LHTFGSDAGGLEQLVSVSARSVRRPCAAVASEKGAGFRVGWREKKNWLFWFALLLLLSVADNMNPDYRIDKPQPLTSNGVFLFFL
jgi:hypothetical protein